jgi:hypothetical protein
VSGTSSGGELVGVVVGNADVSEFMQSRNLDCAVRSDWKDVERWVSSASSWDLSSRSWGMGSWARSTAIVLAPPQFQSRVTHFARPVVAVVTPCFGVCESSQWWLLKCLVQGSAGLVG